MKVHFDAQGRGYWKNGYSECGCQKHVDIGGGPWERIVPPENITTEPSKVTCERCRKTRAFKEAVNGI